MASPRRSLRLRAILVTTSAALALALALPAPVVRANSLGPDVLSNIEVFFETGRTIDRWAAEWWQWAFDNPDVLFDTTGEFGHLGDVGGPVFFAEGSGGGEVKLRYTVPSGQFILLPVATYLWTFFDPCAEPACATRIVNQHFLDGVTGAYAVIDGRRVMNMRDHAVRVNRRFPLIFRVDAGPIDPESGYGGILPAEQAGYWIMLEPLSVGRHRLSFGATVPNLDPNTGDVLPGTIELDTTLDLRVVGRRN
jgi:hypothetical protein